MYKNNKHFSNEAFMFDAKNSIIQMISESNDLELDLFEAGFDENIQRHAPIKKWYVRANQAPFMNKKIHKEIMKRSRLGNKFLKGDIDRNAYNKQSSSFVSLVKNEKKNFFGNIDTSDITDNLVLDRQNQNRLIEKKSSSGKVKRIMFQKKIVSENRVVAEFFKFFFSILLLTCTDVLTCKTVLMMAMTLISSPLMTKLEKQPLEVFCRKGDLTSFAKFTGKHLCQSLFFNKVACLRPATLLQRKLWLRCFPVIFAKFLRTPFFKKHLLWLLLMLQTLLIKLGIIQVSW